MTRPSRIEVHIEELVLHGFDPRDRLSIGDAVQSELSRLFAEGDMTLPRRDVHIDSVDGGAFVLERAAPAEAVGGHVARRLAASTSPGSQARGR